MLVAPLLVHMSVKCTVTDVWIMSTSIFGHLVFNDSKPLCPVTLDGPDFVAGRVWSCRFYMSPNGPDQTRLTK